MYENSLTRKQPLIRRIFDTYLSKKCWIIYPAEFFSAKLLWKYHIIYILFQLKKKINKKSTLLWNPKFLLLKRSPKTSGRKNVHSVRNCMIGQIGKSCKKRVILFHFCVYYVGKLQHCWAGQKCCYPIQLSSHFVVIYLSHLTYLCSRFYLMEYSDV